MMLPMAMRYGEFYAPYLDFAGELKDNGFSKCLCPFHLDSNPSAAVDLQTGVFKCHVCGITYSPYKFYSILTGDSFQLSRCIVENYLSEKGLLQHTDNFIKSSPGRNPKFEAILKKAQSIENNQMAIDYAEGRGLELESLIKLGVKYIDAEHTFSKWNRPSLVFPYFLNGHCVGIRYRDNEGNKSGEEGCHFTLWGLDDLTDEDKSIVLVEGESDRILAWQLLEGKYKVLSKPGAVFKHEWLREFAGIVNVVDISDADEAGQKCLLAEQAVLGNKLKVYELPWKRGQLGKDICDWASQNDHSIFKRDVLGLLKVSSRSTIMTGIEFKETANKPRRFLINKLFTRGQVVVVAGPPKNKKTLFTLDMVRSLLTPGDKFLGHPELTTQVDNCKILFLEEEGDIEELYERSERVLKGTNWENNVHWGHRLGLKIDSSEGTQEIINTISKHSIDVVILDPFSKMFELEEDSAKDIGIIWNNIDRILSTCEDIVIIILHHFSKAGTINDLWNALRGSSRIGASADLGFFIEKRSAKEPDGIKFRMDGRTLKELKAKDGGDIFKCIFHADTGRFTIDNGTIVVDKSDKLVDATKTNGPWTVSEAAKYLDLTTEIVRGWVIKRKDVIQNKDSLLTYIKKD
jgi:hypothetical protein